MGKTWVLAGAAVLVALSATAGVVVKSGASPASSAAQEPLPNTAKVVKGNLSAMVSLDGTLTYRARPDGSPYTVINQASGIFTELPDDGDKIACGAVLYRVNDKPVLLLCGTVPPYRSLRRGDVGNDVRQLNRNLHDLGYAADIDPGGNRFTNKTAKALEKLQRDRGLASTGALTLGAVVVLPESVLMTKVTGELGGSAQPGASVAQATSDTPEVQVSLDAFRQGEVTVGDRAQITLPGNGSATGKVERLGRVAQVPEGSNASTNAGDATIPAFITLDEPAQARGFDRAPVQVEITTAGVESVLSVPVIALVGKSGGGFGVEVVGTDRRRQLVAVHLGLFDTTAGRVQIDGDVHEGDQVVVPST